VPGLLPDETGPPNSIVEPATVRLGIDRPRPDARTYLCIEKSSWNGEIVTSLFVRVAMVNTELYTECYAYVLLPLRAELDMVDLAAARGLTSFAAVVRATFRSAPRRLWSSLDALLRGAGRRAQARAVLERKLRAIRQGRPVDRGAALSIRADAAGVDGGAFPFHTDETKNLNTLERRILDTIRDFLDQHGIDTASFQPHETMIMNRHSTKIGNLLATNVTFGARASATYAYASPPGEAYPGSDASQPQEAKFTTPSTVQQPAATEVERLTFG
jgi:hypothetical protein